MRAPDTLAQSTILVIDDEPANVALIERLLGRVPGWKIVGLTRSADAVERFREIRPDLILLDLRMPHPDGFTLLVELREQLAENEYLPILVLTADSTRQSRERALALGASDFLTKPLDATEVLLRSRNLLETRMLQRTVAGENERLEAQVRERTRELEEALDAARAANRAKDQFLANVRHELRTPLTAIRGAVGLLGPALGGEVPPRARKLVETTTRNTGRLERLIQDILLLQGLQSGSVQASAADVDVGALVQDLVREIRGGSVPEGVELSVALPADLAPLHTDGEKLSDLVRRLVENAIRFTPAGAVTVEVIADSTTRRPRSIVVADTGAGIEPERQESIFHAFEQADNSDTRRHGGLGVGLTIARALADLLGFTISVESAPGQGASFRLDLAGHPPA